MYQLLSFSCRIHQVKYDGTCRHTVTKGLKDYEVYGFQVYGMLNYMLWTDMKKQANGNYRVMKTDMMGNTSVMHQDKYLKRDMKTIMNRKLGKFSFLLFTYSYVCVLFTGMDAKTGVLMESPS